jgi:hypothetical protein
MKVHILRPESITPIALYLDRRRQYPESLDAQIEFASVLLYREREYRTMYLSGLAARKPVPSPDSPFAPFDITTDAAADLAALFDEMRTGVDGGSDRPDDGAEERPDDLFGLKPEAVDGLRRALGPIKSHGFGWLIHARLLTDLCRFREALEAAEHAIRLGEAVPGLLIVCDAAWRGSMGRGSIPDGDAIARKAEARARRLLPKEGTRWITRAQQAFDERVRQRALRTRARVEGKRFTRFLTTELGFCQQERKATLASFKSARVPKELRGLIPLAREFGVGDDPCRGLFIRKIPSRERRVAAQKIRGLATAIDRWLASLGGPPFEGEAAAFFWLLEAADELST